MAESERNGRVLMVEFENRLAESSWSSLDRVADSNWPNPNELADSESPWLSPTGWPNHPGRVRIVLAESDGLAESSWPSPTRRAAGSLWPSPAGLTESEWDSFWISLAESE